MSLSNTRPVVRMWHEGARESSKSLREVMNPWPRGGILVAEGGFSGLPGNPLIASSGAVFRGFRSAVLAAHRAPVIVVAPAGQRQIR